MDNSSIISQTSSNNESPRKYYIARNFRRSEKISISDDGIKKTSVFRDYFFLKRAILLETRENPHDNWRLSKARARFVFKSHHMVAVDNKYSVKTRTPISQIHNVVDEDGKLVSRNAQSLMYSQAIERGGRDYVVTSTNRLTGETRSEIVSPADQEAFKKIESGRASISFGRKARSQAGKAHSSKSAATAEAHSQADLKAAYGDIHNRGDDRIVVWRDAQTNSEIIQRGVSPEHKVLEPPAETVPATGELSRAALASAYKEIHDAGDELAPSQAHEQIRQSSSREQRQTRQDGSGSGLSSASDTGRPRISDGLPVPQPVPLPRPAAGPRPDRRLNKPLPALPALPAGPTYGSWPIPANMSLDPPMAPYLYGTGASRYAPPSAAPFVQPEFPPSHIASAVGLPGQSSSGGLHRLTSRFTRGPDGALSRGPLAGPDPVGLTILQNADRNSLGGLGLDGGAGAFGLLKQQARAQRETGSSSEAGPVPSHRVRGRQGDSNGR